MSKTLVFATVCYIYHNALPGLLGLMSGHYVRLIINADYVIMFTEKIRICFSIIYRSNSLHKNYIICESPSTQIKLKIYLNQRSIEINTLTVTHSEFKLVNFTF